VTATLYAPADYLNASEAVRHQIVNGCGPGGWKIDLVPDTIWGLSIHAACDIHDWQYTLGTTINDKLEADRILLNNIIRLIDAAGGCWLLRKLRRLAALRYYNAVVIFGGPAFWSGKNDQQNLLTVSL